MVFDQTREHPSQWTAISSIAAQIGCSSATLRGWVCQVERDSGGRPGLTTELADRWEALECENRDPAQGICVFCDGGARPPTQAMIGFIDDHRAPHGIEPICKVLPIAPSTYPIHAARRAEPDKLPARTKWDATLRPEIRRVFGCIPQPHVRVVANPHVMAG